MKYYYKLSLAQIRVKLLVITFFVIFSANPIFSQTDEPTETLFGSNMNMGYAWGIDLKTTSIQQNIGTLISINGGAVFYKTFFTGFTAGGNVSHPYVNYSYLGLLAQYSYKPNKMFHPSFQMILAYASTKDYEQEKSSLMDNFLNTSGAQFFFFEPGINLEINLSNNVRFISGVSFRVASGLDEKSIHISRTNVTNVDFSSLNVNIGVKISK